MSERQVMIAAVRQHLLRAQQRMKLQADKKRSERSFSVGDMVYLKLQPYVQSSLAPRAHQKLSFRYFGPYKILEAIGTVAYKLELPPGSSIHPVFHVSLLKPAPPHKSQVSTDIPESDFGLQVPELILKRRLHPRQDGAVAQVLVKWSNMDVDLATWEDAEALHQKFPLAPAWGHAGSQGEGGVSTLPPEASQGNGLRRSMRRRPRSSRVFGPQWASLSCACEPARDK